MSAITEPLQQLWEQAFAIWLSGGWAMIAIAATALVMFGLGMQIWLKLSAKGFASVREKTWRRWIDHPNERKGPIGELLNFVTGGVSLKDTAIFFEELRATEIDPFERDLRVMKICVSAAPLLGLLGTVTGMLATFAALASGSGGDKTMGLVAEGISEALVTTETGLVIALPGLFFQYQLVRKHERYKAFLAHLETVCTQKLYKKLQSKDAVKDASSVPSWQTTKSFYLDPDAVCQNREQEQDSGILCATL
jgi:biopolymer transport protein ExbB